MSLILGDDGELLFPLLEPGHWTQEVPGKISKKLISKLKIEKAQIFGVFMRIFSNKSVSFSQLILQENITQRSRQYFETNFHLSNDEILEKRTKFQIFSCLAMDNFLLFFSTLIEICSIFALQCYNNAMQSYFKAGWKSQKKSVDDGAKKYALYVFLHTAMRIQFF
jgi:hypothetical protein